MTNDDDEDIAVDEQSGGETDGGEAPPEVALALRRRYGRTRRGMGAEPADLERVARYLDGDLAPEERVEMEARIAADFELKQVVEELEGIEERAPISNVIPLVIPSGRASRVGEALPSGLRPPAPSSALGGERGKSALRFAIIGIGATLALAAILFLATRPNMTAEGTSSAGIGDRRDAIAIGFEPRGGDGRTGEAVIEVDAPIAGELTVLLATPDGTRALGLCEAKACLVTQDRVPLVAGKNRARAVLSADLGGGGDDCAFALALTSDGPSPSSQRSAAFVDPHAAATALGTIVKRDGCVLDAPERLEAIAGVRHVAFMKVPAAP